MDDLLELAQRIAGQARRGEQIEAYVARATGHRVRVYEGEIEHFTSAQSEGVGIRVDPRRPDRVRLRRHARRATPWPRCWPRPATTSPSAPRTSAPAWPRPTASPLVELDLWRDELLALPTDDKIDAGQGARAADPGRRQPGAGARTPTTPTSSRGRGGHQHRHRRRRPRDRVLRVGQHPGRRRRRHPDRLRLHRRVESPGELRPGEGGAASGRPGHRAARCDQAVDRRRSRSCSTRSSPPSSSASFGRR